MHTLSPMMTFGPICAVESICAVSAITALGWMPGKYSSCGKKIGQYPGHGHPRIRSSDEDLMTGGKRSGHENSRSLALLGVGKINFFFGKCQVAFPGLICCGKAE